MKQFIYDLILCTALSPNPNYLNQTGSILDENASARVLSESNDQFLIYSKMHIHPKFETIKARVFFNQSKSKLHLDDI